MKHVNSLCDSITHLVQQHPIVNACNGFFSSVLQLLAWALVVTSLFTFAGFDTPAGAQTVISAPISQVLAGGEVRAIARQTDGKVIIGGNFSFVNGIPRNGLARINTDGSLDTNWNPSPDAGVEKIAIDNAGNIYVGGNFKNIGGQARINLAKLSSSGNGAADPTWNPNPTFTGVGGISGVVFDPGSGALFVSGGFSEIGGQQLNWIAKLSTSGVGAADATWNPNPNNIADVRLIDGSGNLYVSGVFTTIGGLPRNHLAKISGSSVGEVDTLWNPSSTGEAIGVNAMALDPLTGGIYIGGSFKTIGGQPIVDLAKLSITGAAVASWNPNVNGAATMLFVDGAGNVYASGTFTYAGGQNRNTVKLSGTTAVADTTWDPFGPWQGSFAVNGAERYAPLSTLSFDSNGSMLVGGSFTYITGITKTGFALLTNNGNGIADLAWPSVQLGGTITAIARDSVGRTVIGGSFSFMGDGITVRNNIARLKSDTILDTTWDPEADFEVDTLAIDSNNNVYAGGKFRTIGGQLRNFLARLAATSGSADMTWNPMPDSYINTLALDDTNGKLFTGGNFATIGGQARPYLAKLSTSGVGLVDINWNPDPSISTYGYVPIIEALTLDGGGNLYVGGSFTGIGGQNRKSLAKLSTSGVGAADANWHPDPTYSMSSPNYAVINALALDGSSNLYVGGLLTDIGGQSRNNLARVSTSGTGFADVTWNPGVHGPVNALALDGSGHLYVGGQFSGWNFSSGPIFAIGGAMRTNLARIFTSGIGTADCNWIANTSSIINDSLTIKTITVDMSGNLYIGGNFTQIDGAQRFGFAELIGSSAAGCKLGITDVNAGFDLSANYPFSLTVQSQDSTGMPQTVTANTIITQYVNTGTGTLSGTTSCQINAGGYTCTMPGLLYSKVESGVVLASKRSSGDTLTEANSAPLNFIAALPPVKLKVIDINGGANPVAGTGFPVSVQAQNVNGMPANVTSNTTVSIVLNAGTGVLTNGYASCQINAGADSCTMTGVTYSKSETGVIFTVSAAYGAGYIAGNSQPLTVDEPTGGKTLTVVFTPVYTGNVASTPAGINCASGNCTAVFPAGSSVTLNYTAAANTFGHWIGDCSGATPSCTLTMDSDKAVSANTKNSNNTTTYTTTSAVQATTTVTGTTDQRADQWQTRLLGRYNGSIVYDQTFSAPFADASVQTGVIAADNAIRAAAHNPALAVDAPVLTGLGSDTVLPTTTSYSDAVTETLTVDSTTYIGPQTIPVGDLGNCILAPTNCMGPVATYTITAGGVDFYTLCVSLINTSRTIVNVTTHLLGSTYLVSNETLGSDADLSALAVSSGALSPAFARDTLNYTVNLFDVRSITVTPTPDDPTAQILVNGTLVASGSASPSIPLLAGNNVVTVEITAQDGTTTNVYTITITLAAADFTGHPISGQIPLNVMFTDASTSNPMAWAWDFGDGSTGAQKNPIHTYRADGQYTVTLTATGTSGASTMTKAGYITVGGTCVNYPYKIGGTTHSYPTIQDAYEAMGNETMQIQALEFAGGLTIDQSITVELQGGWDCDFMSNPGYTIVTGKLTIKDGTVTIENLIIK